MTCETYSLLQREWLPTVEVFTCNRFIKGNFSIDDDVDMFLNEGYKVAWEGC